MLSATLVVALLSVPSQAWSDHPRLTRAALEPVLATAAPVPAETLEEYLLAEKDTIGPVLDAVEAWCVAQMPTYKPRPAGLAFQPSEDPAALRESFFKAARLNPNFTHPLFVRLARGQELQPGPDGALPATLPWNNLTVLKEGGEMAKGVYRAVQPGEAVSPLDVVSSASDEPDFGFDIGLFEDNDTTWGATYGFGVQPFGNPKLDYGSQAPFHMGFYHEADIIYKFAAFLGESYPEARIRLYQELARHAFAEGHPYWGWRFTGFAAHYIEDLSYPYHAQVLPGVSVTRMLWINTLALVGWASPKDDAVQLVSNRHLVFEDLTLQVMKREDPGGVDAGTPSLRLALAETGNDGKFGSWSDTYVRAVMTTHTVSWSKKIDRLVEKWVPKGLVSDPGFEFDSNNPSVDVLAEVEGNDPKGVHELTGMSRILFSALGAHVRNFARSTAPSP